MDITPLSQSARELPQAMEIVVQLETKTARAIQQGLPPQALPVPAQELLRTLGLYGAEIIPQHPQSIDATLLVFFTVKGVKEEDVAQLLQALSVLEAVKAAYRKPAPAMP